MTTSAKVRHAEASDLPLLAEVEVSGGRLFETVALKSALDPNHSTPTEKLRQALDDRLLWVAVDPADRPLGFVAASGGPGTTFIVELSVAHEEQGKGLGAALMRTAIDDARRRGDRAVTLTTFRDVPWNRPFYEKLGFRVLEPTELTPELIAVLADEASRGLAPDERCAMHLAL